MKNCRVVTIKGIDNDNTSPIFNGFEIELEAGDFNFRTGIPNGSVVTWDTDDEVTLDSLVVTSPFTQIYENLRNGDRWHGTLTKKTKFIFKNCLYDNLILARYIDSSGTISMNPVYLKTMINYGKIHTIYMEKPIVFTDELDMELDELTRLDLKQLFIHMNSNMVFSGNILVLKKHIHLTSLGLRRMNNVVGTVESLVSEMCKYVSTDTPSGRTEGNLSIDLRDANCTFLGSKSIQIFNVTFSSTGATVKDSDNNPLKIYTKSNDQWSNP